MGFWKERERGREGERERERNKIPAFQTILGEIISNA